jgi:hypothetical protein
MAVGDQSRRDVRRIEVERRRSIRSRYSIVIAMIEETISCSAAWIVRWQCGYGRRRVGNRKSPRFLSP